MEIETEQSNTGTEYQPTSYFASCGKETVKSLLDKLNYVKKVIVTDPVMPILENALFSNGIIYTSNLESSCLHKTSIGGEFTMPIKTVVAFLAKIKDKTQEVEVLYAKGDYQLRLIVGKVTVNITTEDPSDYPKIEIPREVISELCNEDVQTLIKGYKYSSNDELRPAMMGLFVQDSGCIATDGHRLKIGNFKKPMESNRCFIIPKSAVKVLPEFESNVTLKLANEKPVGLLGECQVKGDKESTASSHKNLVSGNLSISDKNKAYIVKLIDEYYPDYKSVIPDNLPNIVFFNRAELQQSIEQALIFANSATHQIQMLLTQEDKMQIESEDLDFCNEFKDTLDCSSIGGITFKEKVKNVDKESGEETEIEKIIGPVNIGFNGKFLLDTIKESKEERIRIEMKAPNRGVMIDGYLLLMPVMINQYR